jgi:hypothetical protein
MVATSGVHMRKMVKRVRSVEGVVLITNGEEREQLRAFAEGLDVVKFTYVNAAGDEYRAEGTIEIESNETEENRTSCMLHPNVPWTVFVA